LFLHVVGAIAWVGTGSTILLLVVWASRADERAFFARLLAATEWLGNPMTVLLLLLLGSGIWLVLDGPWSFGTVWVGIGLGGYVAALAWGSAVIEPRSRSLQAAILERGHDAPVVRTAGVRLVALLRVELALLAVVVLAMTVKPAPDEAAFWAIAGALLAGAGLPAARALRTAPPTTPEAPSLVRRT
jgi:uncharacterized membrane protein